MYVNQNFEKLLGSTPSSENPLEIPGKKVTVHYWGESASDTHLVIEVDTGVDFTIENLMLLMINKIHTNTGKTKDVKEFVMRIANKNGEPKHDMPTFDISQTVQTVSFVKFALCNKVLDEKAKMKMQEIKFTEESEDDGKEETEKKPDAHKRKIWRKLFCCLDR